MKGYKKTFNPNLIKSGMSYSVQDICELYHVHKQSVLAWLKEGLEIIDKKRPCLIHGDDLRSFILRRQAKRKRKCKNDEFFCLKCREPRKPFDNEVEVAKRNLTTMNMKGLCPVCTSIMNKVVSSKKLNEIRKMFSTVTEREQHLIQCSATSVSTHLKEGNKNE